MKTVEITLYSFDELSEKAKEKAIKKLYEINVEDEWYDNVYELFKENHKNSGFDIDAMYFSGFSSQGDGAMFEYGRLDGSILNEFVDSLKLTPMRKLWLKSQTIISGNGIHSGHYHHEKCCHHSIYFESNFPYSNATNFNNWIESFSEDFESFVISRYENMCKELYRELEKKYESLTTAAAITESIKLNGFLFYGDGKLSYYQ